MKLLAVPVVMTPGNGTDCRSTLDMRLPLNRLSLIIFAGVLLGSSAVGVRSAFSQVVPSAPPAGQGVPVDVQARYDGSIGEAVAEFAAGHWAEARALFTEAHRLYPNARTLRGLGMAEFELRNYAEARRMLGLSLASQVNALSDTQRSKTNSLLDRIHAFVGLFLVEAPAGTVIEVDGSAGQHDADGRLVVNSGKHVIAAILPGGERQQRQFDVRGGEVGTLVFQPAGPAAAALTPAAPPAPLGAPVSQPAESFHVSDEGPSVVPLALMIGGGALAVGSIVTGLMAKSKESEVQEECAKSVPCAAQFEDVADSATTLALVTDVLWITGVVAAGAGLTWMILDDSESASTSVAIRRLDLAAGPASVALRGQF